METHPGKNMKRRSSGMSHSTSIISVDLLQRLRHAQTTENIHVACRSTCIQHTVLRPPRKHDRARLVSEVKVLAKANLPHLKPQENVLRSKEAPPFFGVDSAPRELLLLSSAGSWLHESQMTCDRDTAAQRAALKAQDILIRRTTAQSVRPTLLAVCTTLDPRQHTEPRTLVSISERETYTTTTQQRNKGQKNLNTPRKSLMNRGNAQNTSCCFQFSFQGKESNASGSTSAAHTPKLPFSKNGSATTVVFSFSSGRQHPSQHFTGRIQFRNMNRNADTRGVSFL